MPPLEKISDATLAVTPKLIQQSTPRPEDRASKGRIDSPGARWIQRIWFPALLIVGWELAVRFSLLDPLFFPAPSRLAATAMDMLRRGDLGHSIRLTLARASAGFVIGSIAGIACGAAMGLVRGIQRALEPLVAALYNCPKLTLLPMLMILVGTGETPRLILIAVSTFLMVVMHTHDGVQGLHHYVELATDLGATRWLLLRHVSVPASLPQIFTGLRLGMGRALGIAISSELLTGADGLGGLVVRSWRTFAMDELYVSVIVAALLGASVHGGLMALETRLLPWRKE